MENLTLLQYSFFVWNSHKWEYKFILAVKITEYRQSDPKVYNLCNQLTITYKFDIKERFYLFLGDQYLKQYWYLYLYLTFNFVIGSLLEQHILLEYSNRKKNSLRGFLLLKIYCCYINFKQTRFLIILLLYKVDCKQN